MVLLGAIFGRRTESYLGSLLREFDEASAVADRGVAEFYSARERDEEAKRLTRLNAPRHVHNFVCNMRDKPCSGADLLMLAKLYAVGFVTGDETAATMNVEARWQAARDIIGEAVRQSSLILDLCGSPYGKDLGNTSVRRYVAERIVLDVLGEAYRLWLQH